MPVFTSLNDRFTQLCELMPRIGNLINIQLDLQLADALEKTRQASGYPQPNPNATAASKNQSQFHGNEEDEEEKEDDFDYDRGQVLDVAAAWFEQKDFDIPQEELALLRQISDLRLDPDRDFFTLTTLNKTQFSSISLVRNSHIPDGRVYVMKTCQKQFAYRMRDQNSSWNERALLLFGAQAAQLGSPSIPIPLLCASLQSPTSLHLVMEYIPGGDLGSLLENHAQVQLTHAQEKQDRERQSSGENEKARGQARLGRKPGMRGRQSSLSPNPLMVNLGLDEDWVRAWGAEAVEAIEWVHDMGFVHRDIKPSNLLLTLSGHIKLTDFGSSAQLVSSPADHLSSLSRQEYPLRRRVHRASCRVPVGTCDYVPPEILRAHEKMAAGDEDDSMGVGDNMDDEDDEDEDDIEEGTERERRRWDEGPYGDEVDWWSFGVTIYELLTGETPFFAESIAQTYENIVGHQGDLSFPPTSTLSPTAMAFVNRLLRNSSVRLGRNGAEEIKRQQWFRGVKWGDLHEVPGPYCPPSPKEPKPSGSLGLPGKGNLDLGFNFQEFFSSPGLEILRSRPKTSAGEHEYWVGFTWEGDSYEWLEKRQDPTEPLPQAASSAQANRHATFSDPISSRLGGKPSALSFITPARPSSLRRAISDVEPTPGTALRTKTATASSRKVRPISDMDAWKEMVDYAWEVGMTARKTSKKRTPEDRTTVRFKGEDSLVPETPGMRREIASQSQQQTSAIRSKPAHPRIIPSTPGIRYTASSSPENSSSRSGGSSIEREEEGMKPTDLAKRLDSRLESVGKTQRNLLRSIEEIEQKYSGMFMLAEAETERKGTDMR